MKPLSPGIDLASESVIKQWKNINDYPIVGTSPRNVPISTMIDFPSSAVDIIGGESLDNIKLINGQINLLEKDIYTLYQLRPKATGLKEKIEGKISYEKYSSNVIQILNDLQKNLQDFRNHTSTAIAIIGQIFSQSQIWSEGLYFNELLDQICFLIFKLFCFNALYTEKVSIMNDVQILSSLLDGHDEGKDCIQFIQDFHQKFNSINALKEETIQHLISLNIEPEGFKVVFNVLWKHIKVSIDEHNYIRSDYGTAYIIALLYMIDMHRMFLEHERQLKPKEKENNLILNSLPDDIYPFLHKYREDHPCLILVFEFSIEFDQCCAHYNFAEPEDPHKKKNAIKKILSPLISLTSKKAEQKASITLSEIKNSLFTIFRLFSQDYSTKIANENLSDFDIKSLYLDLINVLQNSNNAISYISEFIILKYYTAQSRKNQSNDASNQNTNDNANDNSKNNENTENNENANNNENSNNNESTESNENANSNENTSNNENNNENNNKTESVSSNENAIDDKNDGQVPKSYYEIAMTNEISDDERDNIMKILTVCRLLRELLMSYYSKVYECLSFYIYNSVNAFIDEIYHKIEEHSKQLFDTIKSEFDKIQEISDSKLRVFSKATYLIRVFRAKLQQFINPESKERMTVKGGIFSKVTLTPEDTALLTSFLKDSKYYCDILQLETTMSIVYDQSSLYFKETLLDAYRSQVLQTMPKEAIQNQKAIYFPLTSSLPCMLINFSIARADSSGELTGDMFYPLSIYDDAAKVALNNLESKILYEEILAESDRTLLLINVNFSRYAFKTVKRYITERYIDENRQSMGETAIHTKKSSVNKNSISRIQTCLQQNMLFLVGHHVELKTYLAETLKNIFISEIQEYEKVVWNYGIQAIFVFSSMIEIYRKIHTFFVECEIPIATFDEIMQISLETGEPNNFSSLLFESINQSLFEKIIPTYSLYTAPYRLFPPAKDNGFIVYVSSNKNNIPISLLGQTLTGITVKHFREVLKFIDDGALYKIILRLKEAAAATFDNFVEHYRKNKNNIHRIRDSPLGIGSNNAFSNYEKVYSWIAKDKDIENLYLSLRQLGNIVAVAEMLDNAYALKSLSEEQFLAYLYMCKCVDEKPGEIPSEQLDETYDDIFKLFGSKYNILKKTFKWKEKKAKEEKESDGNDDFNLNKSYIFNFSTTSANTDNDEYKNKKLVAAPEIGEILQPLKLIILQIYKKRLTEKDILPDFVETSKCPLDFPSLNGFAAVWSVLEFAYCLKECYYYNYGHEKSKSITSSPLSKYGESLLIPVVLILETLKQVPMYKVFSIGEQILRQSIVENTNENNRQCSVSTFLKIYNFLKASANFTLTTLKPSLELKEKQPK